MAHELDRLANGIAAVISVRQSMWHQEGAVLSEAPSIADAIAQSGQDYEVEKVQTFVYNDKGVAVPTPAYVTVRKDRGTQLGVVSASYEVVQNHQAYEILGPLVDEGIATVETAGVLREGADAWMLLALDTGRLPTEVHEVFTRGGDIVKPYILVAPCHSGKRGILVALTSIRVVCANTLGAAEGRDTAYQFRIIHTESAKGKLVEAANSLWGNISSRYAAVALAYRDLQDDYLLPEEFKRLVVDPIAPDPRERPNWNPEAKMAEEVLFRHTRKVVALNNLFEGGTGHTGEPTGWFAYNAAVEALDHNKELWPDRAGVYRTASALDGKIKELKETVFSNLLEHARS